MSAFALFMAGDVHPSLGSGFHREVVSQALALGFPYGSAHRARSSPPRNELRLTMAPFAKFQRFHLQAVAMLAGPLSHLTGSVLAILDKLKISSVRGCMSIA